jgi:SpoVK/Ycf46/Vps4 family AAA+-type ATPase
MLDGLEGRGQIFVIGTSNRPDDIDAALRRPGRFDRVIQMPPPDEAGRAAILIRHLTGLRLAAGLDPESLAAELASLTPGLTGADIAHVCRQAAALCVKAAVNNGGRCEAMAIRREHFESAIRSMVPADHTSPRSPYITTDILSQSLNDKKMKNRIS